MNIGVLCKNYYDFKLWRQENELIPEVINKVNRFNVGNTTYFCIFNETHLCSLTLDDILITKAAKRQDNFWELLNFIFKYNLSVI